LESGEIERVGGAETIKVDVRVISATNQSLESRINEGKFRQDLFHRINVFPITIPPLRDRKEDIIPTVLTLLKNLKKKHQISVDFISHNAMNTLCDYDWPGNVRELENTLERLVLIYDDPIIKSEDVKNILDQNAKSDSISEQPTENKTIANDQSIEPIDSISEDEPKEKLFIDPNNPLTLKELERMAIESGLERTNWNITATAQQLGISRMTLYRKLEQHGLENNG